MTASLPSPVTYGTVKCNVGKMVGDITSDPIPDISLINGKLRVTPSTPTITVLAGSSNNYVLSTPPEERSITNGKLRDRTGAEGIRLIASDSPGKQPEIVQYLAEFYVTGVLKKYQPKPVLFNVVANQVVDLAIVVPVQPLDQPVKVNSYEDRLAVQTALVQAQTATADAIDAADAAAASAQAAEASAAEAHAAILIITGTVAPVPPSTPAGTVVIRTA